MLTVIFREREPNSVVAERRSKVTAPFNTPVLQIAYAGHEGDLLPSAFLNRFGVNRDEGDLREIFLHAVFEGSSDVVDLCDGRAAVHGAMAGGEDSVLIWCTRRVANRLPCGEQFRCV